jgi:hypothetical protein
VVAVILGRKAQQAQAAGRADNASLGSVGLALGVVALTLLALLVLGVLLFGLAIF